MSTGAPPPPPAGAPEPPPNRGVQDESVIQRNQKRLVLGAGLMVLLGVVLYVFATEEPQDRADPRAEGETRSLRYEDLDLAGGTDPEQVWLETQGLRLDEMEARLEELESQRDEALAHAAQLETSLQEMQAEGEFVIGEQATVIEHLEQENEELRQQATSQALEAPAPDPSLGPPPPSPVPVANRQIFDGGASFTPPPVGAAPGISSPQTAGGATRTTPPAPPPKRQALVQFELAPRPQSAAADFTRDTRLYLPAGSYAPAVVLAGVDASVALSSQNNPRPVLFRITEKAVSATENGQRKRIDIVGCTITGQATGDLPTERVYVRINTMTCGAGSHRVVEIPVYGYPAGRGKVGVRGPVTERTRALIERAFWSGLVGGFGSGVSQGFAQANQPVVTEDGIVVRPSESEVAEGVLYQGLGQGFGEAGRRLSDYYLRRLEALQPVVSLNAGTEVEIVFLRGSWLDGRDDPDTTTLAEEALTQETPFERHKQRLQEQAQQLLQDGGQGS